MNLFKHKLKIMFYYDTRLNACIFCKKSLFSLFNS